MYQEIFLWCSSVTLASQFHPPSSQFPLNEALEVDTLDFVSLQTPKVVYFCGNKGLLFCKVHCWFLQHIIPSNDQDHLLSLVKERKEGGEGEEGRKGRAEAETDKGGMEGGGVGSSNR